MPRHEKGSCPLRYVTAEQRRQPGWNGAQIVQLVSGPTLMVDAAGNLFGRLPGTDFVSESGFARGVGIPGL
jgi:hypothetical protein